MPEKKLTIEEKICCRDFIHYHEQLIKWDLANKQRTTEKCMDSYYNIINAYCFLKEYEKAILIFETIKKYIKEEEANKYDLYSNVAKANVCMGNRIDSKEFSQPAKNQIENNNIDSINYNSKENKKNKYNIKNDYYLKEEKDRNLRSDWKEKRIEYENQLKELNSEIISSKNFYNKKIILEYKLGNYDNALESFRALLNIANKEKSTDKNNNDIFDYKIFICIGKIHYFRNDFDNKSILCFNRAKLINKNNWEIDYCLGACFYQLEDYKRAIKSFKNSTTINNNHYNFSMLKLCHKLNNTFDFFVAKKLLDSMDGVWQEMQNAHNILSRGGSGVYNTFDMYYAIKKYARQLIEYLHDKERLVKGTYLDYCLDEYLNKKVFRDIK